MELKLTRSSRSRPRTKTRDALLRTMEGLSLRDAMDDASWLCNYLNRISRENEGDLEGTLEAEVPQP